MRRVGIFGWGLVAPKSPNIDTFIQNLDKAESWLTPFTGFGPNTFMVGDPEFNFEDYRGWIVERFKPNKFSQLESKMGKPVLYAVGSFIQALAQNPGLEDELRRLGERTHIYVGTGVGDLPTQYEQSIRYYRAQRHWNRFWSDPSRNEALRHFLNHGGLNHGGLNHGGLNHGGLADDTLDGEASTVPPHPDTAEETERDVTQDAWWAFWAERSASLREYLEEFRQIEALAVQGEVEAGKMSVIKQKSRRFRKLQQRWGAPEPPWLSVSSNLIWNIDNIAAAQISMLGGLTGPAIAPAAACSTFGVTLKMAMDAIERGEADAAIIGATDPPPNPLLVSAFYNARVISADGQVSKPLTELRGTHVAGGAVVWIVGDVEHMTKLGFKTLGMEPVGVGVTSDADHIITPSQEGPTASIRQAMAQTDADFEELATWDLHATATPGDFNEVELVRSLVPEDVLISARKGIFGHGMAACGGWELTAQYLGYQTGQLPPTTLSRDELNEQIAGVHDHFVFDAPTDAPGCLAGKLSMGIGGINACVISKPWDAEEPTPKTDDGQDPTD